MQLYLLFNLHEHQDALICVYLVSLIFIPWLIWQVTGLVMLTYENKIAAKKKEFEIWQEEINPQEVTPLHERTGSRPVVLDDSTIRRKLIDYAEVVGEEYLEMIEFQKFLMQGKEPRSKFATVTMKRIERHFNAFVESLIDHTGLDTGHQDQGEDEDEADEEEDDIDLGL